MGSGRMREEGGESVDNEREDKRGRGRMLEESCAGNDRSAWVVEG